MEKRTYVCISILYTTHNKYIDQSEKSISKERGKQMISICM